MIELQSVSKSFGQIRAVDGISFATKEGEIFGLLGPNGAGKSTTIKMIMNILAPGFRVHPLQWKSNPGIGQGSHRLPPEERGLYRKVKINEMLLYLASLKNADSSAAEKRLDEWLARFNLTEWKTRTPESLSKGMAQKVQFIASVLHDPEFLFLDEPFSGLDPVSTDVLREAVLELGSRGKTILFSTHNMEVAERICSRLLVIDHGREVISGSVADIKSRYGHNTVAVEFDGTIDFGSLAGNGAQRVPLSPVGGDGARGGRQPPGPLQMPSRPGLRAQVRGGLPLTAQDFRGACRRGREEPVRKGSTDRMGKLAKIIRMEFRLTVGEQGIHRPHHPRAVSHRGGRDPAQSPLDIGGAMGSPGTKIALLGADPRFVQEISPAFKQSRIEVSAVQGSAESLDSQVQAGAYDGYLVMPADLSDVTRLEYVSKTAADFRVMGVLQGVIGKAIVAQRLVKAGISASRVGSLTQSPGLRDAAAHEERGKEEPGFHHGPHDRAHARHAPLHDGGSLRAGHRRGPC